MLDIKELRNAAFSGLRLLEKKQGVKQAEVFVSANELLVMRIGYSTNIPNNALEEPKSVENFGLSARILFDNKRIGFGKADSGLDKNAIEKVFVSAKRNSVMDKEFVSLPSPGEKPKIASCHDNAIMRADDEKAISLAYSMLSGALDALESTNFRKNCNITGELDFLKEKVAVANTNGINAFDQNTIALCALTTILEIEKDVSGMWFDSSTHLKSFNPYNVGKTSAQKAIDSRKLSSVGSGKYRIVLGKQAIADLLSHNFSANLSSVDSNSCPFRISDLGTQFASEQLTIFDDALLPNTIGTKRITDEGLATKKTMLVEQGKLVGFLSNDYYSKKYLKQKVSLPPSNGFRFGGGGRHYNSQPGVSATNLVIESGGFSDSELLKEVRNGLYVGRIWYTYPVNGGTSWDFSSTIRGDSFIINNGEIVSSLIPNTIRINDNLKSMLNSIIGISGDKKASLVWGSEEVVVCPEIAFENVRLERIAVGLY